MPPKRGGAKRQQGKVLSSGIPSASKEVDAQCSDEPSEGLTVASTDTASTSGVQSVGLAVSAESGEAKPTITFDLASAPMVDEIEVGDSTSRPASRLGDAMRSAVKRVGFERKESSVPSESLVTRDTIRKRVSAASLSLAASKELLKAAGKPPSGSTSGSLANAPFRKSIAFATEELMMRMELENLRHRLTNVQTELDEKTVLLQMEKKNGETKRLQIVAMMGREEVAAKKMKTRLKDLESKVKVLSKENDRLEGMLACRDREVRSLKDNIVFRVTTEALRYIRRVRDILNPDTEIRTVADFLDQLERDDLSKLGIADLEFHDDDVAVAEAQVEIRRLEREVQEKEEEASQLATHYNLSEQKAAILEQKNEELQQRLAGSVSLVEVLALRHKTVDLRDEFERTKAAVTDILSESLVEEIREVLHIGLEKREEHLMSLIQKAYEACEQMEAEMATRDEEKVLLESACNGAIAGIYQRVERYHLVTLNGRPNLEERENKSADLDQNLKDLATNVEAVAELADLFDEMKQSLQLARENLIIQQKKNQELQKESEEQKRQLNEERERNAEALRLIAEAKEEAELAREELSQFREFHEEEMQRVEDERQVAAEEHARQVAELCDKIAEVEEQERRLRGTVEQQEAAIAEFANQKEQWEAEKQNMVEVKHVHDGWDDANRAVQDLLDSFYTAMSGYRQDDIPKFLDYFGGVLTQSAEAIGMLSSWRSFPAFSHHTVQCELILALDPWHIATVLVTVAASMMNLTVELVFRWRPRYMALRTRRQSDLEQLARLLRVEYQSAMAMRNATLAYTAAAKGEMVERFIQEKGGRAAKGLPVATSPPPTVVFDPDQHSTHLPNGRCGLPLPVGHVRRAKAREAPLQTSPSNTPATALFTMSPRSPPAAQWVPEKTFDDTPHNDSLSYRQESPGVVSLGLFADSSMQHNRRVSEEIPRGDIPTDPPHAELHKERSATVTLAEIALPAYIQQPESGKHAAAARRPQRATRTAGSSRTCISTPLEGTPLPAVRKRPLEPHSIHI